MDYGRIGGAFPIAILVAILICPSVIAMNSLFDESFPRAMIQINPCFFGGDRSFFS